MISYDIRKLERARAIKGWSKGRLARAVGITPQAITQIWKGETKNFVTLKNIADVLGVEIEEILIEEPQDQPAA
jgi:transcriptional regulator with XRE-family HTH domain